MINFPIAGNDDAIRSIRIILQKLVDAVLVADAGISQISPSLPESGNKTTPSHSDDLAVVKA